MTQKLQSVKNGETNETKLVSIPEIADYETALDAAGYGKFSCCALVANVFAFFSGGMENCIMSYVLPAARCDLELSTYQTGLINMGFMAGGIVSAFFWAIIGDVFGRRNSLMLTLLLDGILTFAQSFSPDFKFLLAARCFNGFLIGAASALVLSFAADLIGLKKRYLYVSIVGTSYVVPWLVMPALAWSVIPFKIPDNNTILPIHSWRLFLALGCIPPLIGGIWLSFMPESPRFLLDTNRPDEALEALNNIYKMNHGRKAEFVVKKLVPSPMFETKAIEIERSRIAFLFKSVIGDLKLFVSRSYILKSTLIAFAFLANMSAGFGLNFWIPELLLRVQGHDGDCDASLVETKLSNSTNVVWEELAKFSNTIMIPVVAHEIIEVIEECNDVIDREIFTQGLMVGSCCVLANAIFSTLSARSGPRGLRVTSALFAGLTAVSCAGIAASACSCSGSSSLAVVSAAVLNSASLVGNVMLMTFIIHAVPAKLGSMAISWGCWWGRVGGMASNFAVGALLDLSCPTPFIGVGAILVLSIVALFLIKSENEGKFKNEDKEDISRTAVNRYYISVDPTLATTKVK